MKRIAQGENALIRRNLKKTDGTDLLLADITTLSVDIMQSGNVLSTIAYPNAKLREGESTSQVELEVVQATSELFKKGRVSLRWTIVVPSALFSSDTAQKKIIDEDVLTVI